MSFVNMSFVSGVRHKCKNIIGTGYASRGITLKLQIYTKNDIILGTKFNIYNNTLKTTVDSVETEWLKGKNINNCLTISNNDITNYFKFSQAKAYTSILIEKAIKNAIINYNN